MNDKPKIVVVGGGIAGIYAAKKLNATLITDQENFTFQPLLTEAITRKSPIKPVSDIHDKVIFDKAKEINQEKKTIITESQEIPYDILIVAIGSQAAIPVPGVKTYAKTFYTEQDAIAIREALPKKNIIIVGGGPTGVELAMSIPGKITLLHAGTNILEQFTRKCIEYTEKELVKKGVKVICNEKVNSITSRKLSGKQNYQYDLCIWTAGIKPRTIKGLPQEKGILVNKFLQASEQIFAIGDCAQTNTPRTAQSALQQAQHTIKNVNRLIKKKPLKPFNYKEKGKMLELGEKAYISSRYINIKGRLAAIIRKNYYKYILSKY